MHAEPPKRGKILVFPSNVLPYWVAPVALYLGELDRGIPERDTFSLSNDELILLHVASATCSFAGLIWTAIWMSHPVALALIFTACCFDVL